MLLFLCLNMCMCHSHHRLTSLLHWLIARHSHDSFCLAFVARVSMFKVLDYFVIWFCMYIYTLPSETDLIPDYRRKDEDIQLCARLNCILCTVSNTKNPSLPCGNWIRSGEFVSYVLAARTSPWHRSMVAYQWSKREGKWMCDISPEQLGYICGRELSESTTLTIWT